MTARNSVICPLNSIIYLVESARGRDAARRCVGRVGCGANECNGKRMKKSSVYFQVGCRFGKIRIQCYLSLLYRMIVLSTKVLDCSYLINQSEQSS